MRSPLAAVGGNGDFAFGHSDAVASAGDAVGSLEFNRGRIHPCLATCEGDFLERGNDFIDRRYGCIGCKFGIAAVDVLSQWRGGEGDGIVKQVEPPEIHIESAAVASNTMHSVGAIAHRPHASTGQDADFDRVAYGIGQSWRCNGIISGHNLDKSIGRILHLHLPREHIEGQPRHAVRHTPHAECLHILCRLTGQCPHRFRRPFHSWQRRVSGIVRSARTGNGAKSRGCYNCQKIFHGKEGLWSEIPCHRALQLLGIDHPLADVAVAVDDICHWQRSDIV